jgi:hypothetical protein
MLTWKATAAWWAASHASAMAILLGSDQVRREAGGHSKNPSRAVLNRLAQTLGVPVTALLE